MALVAIWIVGLTSSAFVPITTRICAPTPPLIGAPGATRFSAPTQSSVGDETQSQHVPAPVFALNAATKWLVVAAQTTAVITRRDLVSPYIVIGSIVASFGTAALKRLIGQQRPAGSPFTDPGMPSSHALVGTFAAVGWAVHLRAPLATFWLLLSAAVIALLRVAAGYHTWAQVIVGSTLGATTACAWMAAGAELASRVPRPAALRVVYAIYVLGSALFIGRKMATWPGSERRRTRGGAPVE
jgi:membrane-associated phospholipid phosphatase